MQSEYKEKQEDAKGKLQSALIGQPGDKASAIYFRAAPKRNKQHFEVLKGLKSKTFHGTGALNEQETGIDCPQGVLLFVLAVY